MGAANGSNSDEEINAMAQRILTELQSAKARDLEKESFVKRLLRVSAVGDEATHETEARLETDSTGEVHRNPVTRALLLSIWLQRLYFIIRAALMSLVGTVVTFAFVAILGPLSFVRVVESGITGFVIALLVTRLFEAQIDAATRAIVRLLSSHSTIRDLIMDHF